MLACQPPAPSPSTVTEPDPLAIEAPKQPLAEHLTLLAAGSRSQEGHPELVLKFDRPLAGNQPFDQRIDVKDASGKRPQGAWIYDSNENLLRFPFVAANRSYTLSLSGELAAADGTTLGAKLLKEVHSGNLPPLLVFASKGSVLRAGDQAGLPVVSVNASEADLEFFRVPPQRYSQFFERWRSNGQRSQWELREIAKLAESVYANRFALEAPENERTVNQIPVQSLAELREPGLYFAVMRQPGSFDGRYEATHFTVTDLGLHVRTYPRSQWVHVASLGSGRARAGVALELLDAKGALLGSAETDGAGNATFDLPATPDQVLIARAGDEISLLSMRQPALDLSDFSVGGRPQTALDAFIWSGRDLYRPGETLDVSILLRDFDGRLPEPAPPVFAQLRQPDGRSLSARVLEPAALGAYRLQAPVAEDAATGRWQLVIQADAKGKQVLGRWDFRVEEFLPERMKLALNAPDAPLKPGTDLNVEFDGAFLYGAPAAGQRITADLIYRPAVHPISSRKDFFYASPEAPLPKEPQAALDAHLDEQGKYQATLGLIDDSKATAHAVEVRVAASLFESGGRAIRRSLVRNLLPHDVLIGVRPMFDYQEGADVNSDAGFEFLLSDAAGQLQAGSLSVTLVRKHRDYHWRWNPSGGWRADWSLREEEVEQRELQLSADRPLHTQFRLAWGEYEVRVSNPTTQQTLTLPVQVGWRWNGSDNEQEPRPDKVRLQLDRSAYRAGETLTVTLNPPYDGPGVLLVETDSLLSAEPFQAREGLEIQLPVSNEWERHDVYLTALMFRPVGTADMQSPPRAIGVVHVPMERRDRDVALSISEIDVVRPGAPINVEVSAPALAGKQAQVQLKAVDLGVLALTGYEVPDAASYFFAPRALGVDGRDLYGKLIERLGGSRARLRYGGDAAFSGLPQARRPTSRTKTAEVILDAVAFDAEGKARLEFAAPEFNGALRISALAYSTDHYGKASNETKVRAPLVVEVSSPRVMAPGDTAQLTIDLHNTLEQTQSFALSIELDDALSLLGGSARQSFTLNGGERKTLKMRLQAGRASDGENLLGFRVSAKGDQIDWSQRAEFRLRSAWPGERLSQARQLSGPTQISLGQGWPGVGRDDIAALNLTLSSQPPLPLTAAAKGLIGYPHGCIEQTSSRLWPLVLASAETRARFGLDDLTEDERRLRVRAGLDRIAAMQLADGNFGYWPGDAYANPQMTAYVAELLLAAREQGFEVSQAMLDKSLQRLTDDLLSGGDGFWAYENSGHLRFASLAHAGYVLATQNRAPLGTLRSLWDHERQASLTALPLLQLGLALQLQGDSQRAEQAFAEALAKEDQRPNYLGDYGSTLRDHALMLALATQHEVPLGELAERMKFVSEELQAMSSRGGWLSTQDQLAVFRLGIALLKQDLPAVEASLKEGSASQPIHSSLFARHLKANDLRNPVQLDFSGPSGSWLMQDALVFRRLAPEPKDSGLRIRRSWFRMDGSRYQGEPLREGDTLLVQLSVESNENVPDAIITDRVPGGLEIENLGLGDRGTLNELTIDGTSMSERYWAAEKLYEEYRDDRFSAAVKLYQGQQAKLFYLARAVSPGDYVVPPPIAEDMYRPDIRSIGPREFERLVVKEAGK
ncbi:alpha-2-macroglobulin family protein [Pseudomarimonas arenosa]|uniref:alpha-2-macroglobulin family protein n=1 Tax=Pseudomarimonas arenosa TaxID=2774145 RepID=UPI001CDC298F|nr:alpha-2-macroglobulin [Pseudomarimonas arenosa]